MFRESLLGKPVDGVQWIDSPRLPEAELAAGLAELSAALDERNLSTLLSCLTVLVPEYQPSALLLQQTAIPAAQ
jgi:hypothetical protein